MAGTNPLWLWFSSIGGTCGFAPQTKSSAMWVRAQPELTQKEVPGIDEEMLERISAHGGSLEEKIEGLLDAFKSSARHLEGLQTLLRLRAVEKKSATADLPEEVRSTISGGTYLESFLTDFDGQSFPLYAEEIVPMHEYRLALEVHSGGAYWSGIPVQDAATVVHKVETVGACSHMEGSASIVAQYGAAQRGAVFVWRWHYEADRGPYAIPPWLEKVLCADGDDPLRKLQSELESIRRWEQMIRQETAQHVKAGRELKDPYIREVLRLWPSELDAQGGEQLKKCAWVEGLDSKLFVGRGVQVIRVLYDDCHSLSLHAVIAKRHQDEPAQEKSPPYRLTTTWQWVASPVPDAPKSAATLVESSALDMPTSRASHAAVGYALPSISSLPLPSRQDASGELEVPVPASPRSKVLAPLPPLSPPG